MIHVLAKIELVPGGREQFLAEFHKLVPTVLAEQGCVEYGPTTDAETSIERQARLGDDVVMVIEKWASLQALEAHLVAPHMTAYREAVKDLVVGTTVHVLEPS